MDMKHWDYTTIDEFEGLVAVLELMEGLHYEAMMRSSGPKQEEHAILSQSYREAINYLKRLREEGMILPF